MSKLSGAAERAAARLRAEISHGQLVPGTKLGEHRLADRLSISRNTLREAFHLLGEDGLVEKIPHRGVFVARPTHEDVREIYQLRRMIEPAAIMWGHLTDEQLRTLDEATTAALDYREAGAVSKMADVNQLVHETIASMTGSTSLIQLMDRTLARVRLVFHGMAEVPDFHSMFVDDNRHVVTCLLQDQREEAAALIPPYFARAESLLLTFMSQSQHDPEPLSDEAPAPRREDTRLGNLVVGIPGIGDHHVSGRVPDGQIGC
ncbi:GntR family transcriptional regulator [Auritidibacter ignavus]|uniref:GntR family transcriptional regulator n=1 Tax=Auritidibacter ignavus TaxID=678932 RepID=UPI00109C54D4|nr:GntR family transcriptional regulator [Auritidibacter ignavus]